MKLSLRTILEEDSRYESVREFDVIRKVKDPLHLERRMQSRAITVEAIQVAFLYGERSWIRGAYTFTLTDRSLVGSPFEKYQDKLRGLKVVCLKTEKHFAVLTVLWNYGIKRKRTSLSSSNRSGKGRGRSAPSVVSRDSKRIGIKANASARSGDRRRSATVFTV